MPDDCMALLTAYRRPQLSSVAYAKTASAQECRLIAITTQFILNWIYVSDANVGELKHSTGSDNMCDIVPTASDVSVKFNITVRRVHESVVTDNPFTQNIKTLSKRRNPCSKTDHHERNLFGSNAFR